MSGDFSKKFESQSRFFFRRDQDFFLYCYSRRDRDWFPLYLVFRDETENLLYQHLGFREGDEKQKINSEDQARILDANSRENSRQCLDWLYSVSLVDMVPCLPCRLFIIHICLESKTFISCQADFWGPNELIYCRKVFSSTKLLPPVW